ncbi:MAG: ArsR/SmtB family transcription factor [Miltoncostaeaceae bacterium]
MTDHAPIEMTDQLVERVAQRLSSIGDPTRIRLLNALRDGEASVGELTEVAGTTQQNVSRHLRILHGEGILERRRDGNYVRYRIADPAIFAICDAVCGGVIAQVDRERAAFTDGEAA